MFNLVNIYKIMSTKYNVNRYNIKYMFDEKGSDIVESFFDVSKIKPFDLKDLDGKTLKIIVSESENIIMVAGQDIESKDIYVLSQQSK